jgi:chromosome segregation ATPase
MNDGAKSAAEEIEDRHAQIAELQEEIAEFEQQLEQEELEDRRAQIAELQEEIEELEQQLEEEEEEEEAALSNTGPKHDS